MAREHSYNSGRIQRKGLPNENTGRPVKRAPQQPAPAQQRQEIFDQLGDNKPKRQQIFDQMADDQPRRQQIFDQAYEEPPRREQPVRQPHSGDGQRAGYGETAPLRRQPQARGEAALQNDAYAGVHTTTLSHAARPRKRKKRWPVVLLSVLLVLAVGFGGVYAYINKLLDPGAVGVIAAENKTPKEYRKKTVNILIVGIDNEEGRDYGKGLGQTDMILYANFLPKEGKLNLLQIPRDSYVGEIPGSNGKMNSLLITGSDTENPINNLVNCINEQYNLPVDYYISLDMDGMKNIINNLGGLKVYVPKDMDYGGSRLEQGWRWLNGEEAEFFVRNRHGDGFERADLDRLDNQRHFYSALFRRLLTLTPGDIVKLMPSFEYYCNTDITTNDVLELANIALTLEPDGVMFCKVPGATSTAAWSADPTGQGRSVYAVDVYGRGTEEDPGLANLLNQYFRTYGESVSTEQMGGPKIQVPESVALYPPNVQFMSQVQEPEGGGEVDVAPGA